MIKAQVLSQTFIGRVEWIVEGRYVKLLTAAANLQLELYQGAILVLLAPAVKAGFYQRAEFDRIVITNTGSQLTEVLIAPDQGGSDAFTANSAITSPLDADNADAGASLGANGLVAVASRLKGYNGATWDRIRADAIGGAGALRITERGFTYGASYSAAATLAANTSGTIFAAGSNPNGAILWRASMMSMNAAGGLNGLALAAHTAAPNSITVGDVIASNEYNSNAAQWIATLKLERPVFIPAGKGLFITTNVAETGAMRSALYTLL